MVEEGRAAIPGCGVGEGGDIVAPATRDGKGGELVDADLLREGAIVGADLLETSLVIADQIHLFPHPRDLAAVKPVREIDLQMRLSHHPLDRVARDRRTEK